MTTEPDREHDDAPPAELLAWALASVAPSGRVHAATSMSQSGVGGPWRLELADGDGRWTLALKAARPGSDETRRFATEVAALEFAQANGVPAPRPVAHDFDADGWLVSLTTFLKGTSSIAADVAPPRLRALGGAAAQIHVVSGTPTQQLPVRSRSLEGYDLNEAATSTPSTPLLARAREVLARGAPRDDDPHGFVHGDFWQGNTLWDGDRYGGAVDWDFAGFGPAGVDLGSLRADVAVLHGLAAAGEVLSGWEETARRPAPNLAWWDVVASVSTPDDMRGWLPNFHAQGRTDLDLHAVTRRRDDYLEQALEQLA